MRSLFGWAVALALFGALLCGSAYAAPYTEIGDAGRLPATAQPVPGGTTSISGTIVVPAGADLFRFGWAGGAFAATTVGTPGTLSDPQLFLFSAATSNGIIGNDDVSNSNLDAAVMAILTPGDYYIGISSYDNDPLGPGGEIFTDNYPGVQTPTGPGGPGPLTGWSNAGWGGGTYRINFRSATSAPIPEPVAIVLAGLGLAGVFFARRRRKRA